MCMKPAEDNEHKPRTYGIQYQAETNPNSTFIDFGLHIHSYNYDFFN